MKCLKKGALILCCALMTTTLVLSTNDMDWLQSDRPSSDVVKRSNPKAKTSSCQGAPGLPGRDGRDGRDATLRGARGQPGVPGPPGPSGPAGQSSSTGGVVYTRWGRKHCPGTSKTVELYSGAMGGSYYNHHGGASNYLCLPLNPIYEKYASGIQSSANIHGTEYEILGTQNRIFPNTDLHDDNAPCAVCHAKSRGSHVMIPARNVCPSGWTMEYKGYLMAASQGHAGRTQFICVDGAPEAIHGSQRDTNGALLYFAEGYCGHSLLCPPYVHGRELTCVVCTQ